MTDYGLLYETWLECAYKYYILGEETCWYDCEFDYQSRFLLENWGLVTHKYKHLVNEDDLRCGTGFAIKWPKELVEKYT